MLVMLWLMLTSLFPSPVVVPRSVGTLGAALVEVARGAGDRDPWADTEARARVQIELVSDVETAERVARELERELEDRGLSVPIFVEVVESDPELPPAYRVAAGPFGEFEDAERARLDLEEAGVRAFVAEIAVAVGC